MNHIAPLTPTETRILGSLLEKERTTPENYPLSINALTAACNQSTNRDPVMALGEREIEEALEVLRFDKKLSTVVFGGGSRVVKYRHNLAEIYNFDPREYALLCVLLLRGPQTAGELRARAERMAPFASVGEVESALQGLSGGDDPVVRLLAARPGQKERRYAQLFSDEPVDAPESAPRTAAGEGTGFTAPRTGSLADVTTRLETAEREIGELRAMVSELREELVSFRKQFE